MDDQWTKISFSGYYDLVSQAAKAFIKVIHVSELFLCDISNADENLSDLNVLLFNYFGSYHCGCDNQNLLMFSYQQLRLKSAVGS